MNDSSLQIELPCPQCGAGVTLHETDRVLSCAFCRVKLYLHCEEPFHCYFPPGNATDPDGLFFLPYWRFRGVAYALDTFHVVHQILDTTVKGCDLHALPYSLGMRSQAVKLHFLTPGVPGRFVNPSLSKAEFLKRLGHGLRGHKAGDGQALFRHAFIGETLSLLYTPFRFSEGALRDGLTGKIAPSETFPRESIETFGEITRKEPALWSTLCPECGWDLQGERDSTVLFCPNCQSAWEAGTAGFEEIETLFLQTENEPDAWLPFWQLKVALPGIPMESQADFVRLTKIPSVVRSEMENRPFAFWVPAFKVNPSLFLRLSQTMTIAQQEAGDRSSPNGGKLFPSNLPAAEAFQSVPIVLGAVTPAREGLFPVIRNMEPILMSRRLIHIPFKRRGAEYIQTTMGFALPLASLRWGRSL